MILLMVKELMEQHSFVHQQDVDEHLVELGLFVVIIVQLVDHINRIVVLLIHMIVV